MTETLHLNGYDGSVLFDPEDSLFHGRILGIRDFILYDGATQPELESHFQDAVGEYLRFSREDGKQPETPFEPSPSTSRRTSIAASPYWPKSTSWH